MTNSLTDTDGIGDALQIYDALVEAKQLADHTLLTYRFRACRCTVLHIVGTPQGTIMGFPRYKTSTTRTAETSTPSGQLANTTDGQGKWKRHAGYLMPSSTWDVAFEVKCDHVSRTLKTSEIESALESPPGKRVVVL